MSHKILIVDDFEIIRSNLKKILYQLGVKNVTEAVDGQDALAKMLLTENLSQPFNMIFLDWNMPKMNGFDFLTACKSDTRFKEIPIIMTTAEREKKSVISALNAGAADYIVKPFKAFIIQEKFEKFKSTSKVA